MAQIRKDSRGRNLQKGEIQEKNGRYIYSYTDAAGKRRKAYAWRLLPSDRYPKEYLYEPSLREREQQIQEDLAAGIMPEGKRQTVTEMCRAYVKIANARAAENTRASYTTAIHLLEKEPFGNRKIGEVSMADAKAFVVYLQEEENYGYSSISSAVGVLRPAYDQAVDDGFARRNPFRFILKNVIKDDTKHRDALTAPEMADFLSFVKQNGYYGKYYNGFYLQFFTGIRVSELCGLTISDVDFGRHCLYIRRQLLRTHKGLKLYTAPTKTIAGIRKVPLTQDTEKCLQEIIKARPVFPDGKEPEVWDESHSEKTTGFLFFDKNNRLTVAQHWMNYYRHAAEAYHKRWPGACRKEITSHVARHTYCSLRVREGMQPKTLQKIMGHNSIRTTLGWYTHLTEEDVMTEALDLMNGDNSLCRFDDPVEAAGGVQKEEIKKKPDYSHRVAWNKGKKTGVVPWNKGMHKGKKPGEDGYVAPKPKRHKMGRPRKDEVSGENE